MRFTCEKNSLVQGLNIASRTVAQKSSLSVIEGILCKAGLGICLTGYNMETAITYCVRPRSPIPASASSRPSSSATSSGGCPRGR